MSIPDPTDPCLIAGDVDFYCAGCGYNLRGLAGDPKRCPECGHLNPIRLLVIPAEAIRQAWRRLETAPTAAFAGLLLLGGAALLLIPGALTCSAMLCVPGLLGVLFGTASFAGACQHHAGWFGALLRYFLYATLMLAAGIGMPIGLLWAVGSTLEHTFQGGSAPCAWLVLALGVAAIPAVLSVRVLYPAAQDTIRGLQRETAVRMAREAYQQSIARQMRR